MPVEEKDLKTRVSEAWTAVKHIFKPEQATKTLDQETVEKELSEFVKINGYNANDPNFDIEDFQSKFIQFLKQKNYDFAGIDASLIPAEAAETEGGGALKALKNVRNLTEDLNDLTSELSVFVDTTKMLPGLVCYVIEKIAPTSKKPYVTYHPVPRVITQVHDSGVNGGTIFFTYNHKISRSQNFNGETSVVSEDEVIYSPLTKEHADYICKLLNIQSKQVYLKHMRELAKQKLILQHVK